MNQWVGIINRTEARIFNAEDMSKIYTLKNSAGKQKNREFTTDKPGVARNRSLSKSSTHSLTGEKSPHNEAAKAFARKISEYLRKRHGEGRFASLLLIAEPRMQGWVRKELDPKIKKLAKWKSKDLAKASDQEIKILILGKEAVWPRAKPRSNS